MMDQFIGYKHAVLFKPLSSSIAKPITKMVLTVTSSLESKVYDVTLPFPDITKRPGKGIDNNVQSDGASSVDVTSPSTPDICAQEVSKEAYKCRRKKRRWYFDAQTGTCVKFRGCEGDGNNFSRKKFCKKQCIRKKTRSRKGRKNRRRNRTKGIKQNTTSSQLYVCYTMSAFPQN